MAHFARCAIVWHRATIQIFCFSTMTWQNSVSPMFSLFRSISSCSISSKSESPSRKQRGAPDGLAATSCLIKIPQSGKIFFVRDGKPQPKQHVLSQWQRTLFLREESTEARGWLIEVMKCVESIGKKEFDLDDVYRFEAQLSQLYPNNRHVKQKIRQQLQFLRDRGYLDFVSRGFYRLRISRLG